MRKIYPIIVLLFYVVFSGYSQTTRQYASSDIETLLADLRVAVDGDIFELTTPGDVDFYAIDTIGLEIHASITIRAASSLSVKPLIKPVDDGSSNMVDYLVCIKGSEINCSIESIELQGNGGAIAYAIRSSRIDELTDYSGFSDPNYNTDSIVQEYTLGVINCNINRFEQGIKMYPGTTANTIDIAESTFSDLNINGIGGYLEDPDLGVNTWNFAQDIYILNCTFHHIGGEAIRIDPSNGVDFPNNPYLASINIDHCTFDNCGYPNGVLDVENVSANIVNSIISNSYGTSYVLKLNDSDSFIDYMGYFNISSTDTIKLEGSAIEGANKWAGNPFYEDENVGNYTLGEGALFLLKASDGKSLGDPKWDPITESNLSDIKINGVSIEDFNTLNFQYTHELPYGTIAVPVVTVVQYNNNASTTITPASSIPGTTTIEVTSDGDLSTKTYSVQFTTVAANTDTLLSELKIDDIALDEFTSTTFNYDVVLPLGTTELPVVTATTANDLANHSIVNVASLPGTATITVTAESGATSTYSINFSVEQSADATLSDLRVNNSTIENFSSSTLAYTYTLPFGTTLVPTVTAEVTNTNAAYQITNATSIPGTTSILVTAEDNETQNNYTIQFTTLAANTDTLLSELKIDDIALDEFTSTTFNYDVVLPLGTTELPVVTATTANDLASNSIVNVASLPGTATITVTAESGATSTYSINFSVEQSTDATLSDLRVNNSTIENFSSSTLAYTYTLPFGTTLVPTVTAEVTNNNAAYQITNATSIPGTTSILVTAEDNETQYNYTIQFTTLAANTDTLLSELKIDDIALDEFTSTTFNYDVVLPLGTTELPVVTATTANDLASNSIVNVASLPGTATITVTAESGATSTYSINFSVEQSADATLSDLRVNNSTIENFSPSITAYTIKLASGTTIIPTVTATPNDENATHIVAPPPKLPGTTSVIVFAQDGTTFKTYTVEFSIGESTDTTLSNIWINGSSISNFSPSTFNYEVELPFGTNEVPEITASTSSSLASEQVTPTGSIPGTTTILVTAENGSTGTYSVIFTLGKNSDISLSDLTIDDATVADFSPTTFNYSVELPFGTTEIPEVIGIPNYELSAAEVTPTLSLPGTTTILVTADNEEQATYTVKFTLGKSPDATLSNLLLDSETISEFSPSTFYYTVELTYGTTSAPEITGVTNYNQASVEVFNTDILPGISTILVTAEDGTTQQTYSVYFTIAKNPDASLKDLKIDGTTITDFSPANLDYFLVLPFGSTIVPKVTAIANFNLANATVNPTLVLPGTSTITVTAEDGTINTYTVTFSIGKSSDPTLNDIKIDQISLANFTPSSTEYTVVLPYGTTEVPEVSFTTNHISASAEITTLATTVPGATIIEVTAENEVATKIYTINFTIGESSDASLSEILIDGVYLPGFLPTIFNYTIELPYGSFIIPEITANVNHYLAVAKITPATEIPGSSTIVVTANNGSKQTYTINFTDRLTAIPEVESQVKFNIYSTGNLLHLSSSEDLNGFSIEVYNTKGSVILRNKLHEQHQQIQLSERGILIARIRNASNNIVFTQKVLVY